MQMAASAFDILIGSVSDNIGLRWVWTNQRCNRTACIHRMQFKGLGVPNKYFATQNKQMYIRLHCLRVLWSLSRYFPNLKIILRSRPSIFKFHLMRAVIFLLKKFSSLQLQQAGRADTTSQVLNLIFYKSSFKTLVGLRPNPMFSTRMR